MDQTIHLKAIIYMGSQKREYPLCEFTDEELLSIVNGLRSLWGEKPVEISIHCNTPETTNIHIECNEVELDSLIRFEAKGEWLEKQNLYVKFINDE